MIRLRGEKSDARFVDFVFYCPRFWISMFSHTWYFVVIQSLVLGGCIV